MKTALRFRSTLGPTLLFTASYSLLSCDCEKNKGEEVTDIAQRLKTGLRPHKLRLSRTTSDGIQTYTPTGNFGRFGADGMIVARVASVDIRCNQGELVKLWLDQRRRADWDTSCSSIKIIAASDTDATGDLKPVNTAHFVEKTELGPLFPLRDYVIQVFEPFPAALVDTESLSSRVFVNIDASGEIPRSWLFVRGKQNSILVIEPKGQNYTTVTYCIEKDPSGWAWISPFLVNAVAGSSPISILKDLKAALEETPANKISEPAEEAAQKKQKEILKPTAATSMVEDKSASRNDLIATLKLLEEKLVRVTKTEKTENIDLSDLKRRIKEDIEKGKHLIAISSKSK